MSIIQVIETGSNYILTRDDETYETFLYSYNKLIAFTNKSNVYYYKLSKTSTKHFNNCYKYAINKTELTEKDFFKIYNKFITEEKEKLKNTIEEQNKKINYLNNIINVLTKSKEETEASKKTKKI